MRLHLALASYAALSLGASISLAAQDHAGHHTGAGSAGRPERLGTVSFPSSGAPAAQKPFLRGLALLHSFEYDDARAAFREAQRADTGFAMAYWGEALTFGQLLWGLDYADSARTSLSRLAPTREARLARARTPRERRYGAAVEALFDTIAQPARVKGYIAGLRGVVAAEPKDLEARALLAIALLMEDSPSPDTTRTRTEESIALAQSVFAAAPDHPGGAHYLIHAADDPRYAARGLAAARAYAKIAPDAEHALHMPSHIFVQVGAWPDVVSSNERAWAASRSWVGSHGVPNTELSFHALSWLQYGYLQQGRHAAAKALLDTASMVLAGIDWSASEAIDARHAAEMLRFSQARETEDWSVYGGRAPRWTTRNAKVSGERARIFGTGEAYRVGFVAALLGDTAVARQAIDSLPERAVLHRAQIAALMARARGDTSSWIASLQAAATAEEKVVHFGPPSTYPSHELLGDALLAAGRAREAVAAYEKSLELMPNRSLALLHLARAQRAAGDAAGAKRTEARLRENWKAADSGVARRVASGG